MSSFDVCTFLLVFSLIAAMAALFSMFRSFSWSRLVTSIVAIGAVVTASWLGGLAHVHENLYEYILGSLASRNSRQVISTALGLATGLGWMVGSISNLKDSRERLPARSWLGSVIKQAVLSLSVAGVVLLGGTFVWNELYRFDRLIHMLEPGFVVECVADFEDHPIRVCMGANGEVFVSCDQAGNGFDYGIIKRLTPDPKTGLMKQSTAAHSPLLYRPYGLTFKDGALYVSRSGHRPRAVDGRIIYEPAGAVTQLRDVDDDGYFGYYNDVVTDLPGSGGPDPQHQNNGLLFGPDGSLYVTNGVSSNRSPGMLPWEGTVLRVPPGFGIPEVFSRGFRNPFGITIGPKGQIFVTDNDVDANPGDELDHLVQGGHYGHPYVIPGETQTPSGAIDPIYVAPTTANITGLAYTESKRLPEKLRGCFFTADTHGGRILRLRPVASGNTFKIVEAETFVTIAHPVDLCISEDGDFFVLARYAKKLYRIRPVTRDKTLARAGGR